MLHSLTAFPYVSERKVDLPSLQQRLKYPDVITLDLKKVNVSFFIRLAVQHVHGRAFDT